jgi:hypothetical protein
MQAKDTPYRHWRRLLLRLLHRAYRWRLISSRTLARVLRRLDLHTGHGNPRT